jgi:CHAT domain-containing protein/anti-sigma-K factor RskA
MKLCQGEKNMAFPNAKSLIYRYLLGEVADEERREVEERASADEDYRGWLRAGEHELIAAYTSGDLTEAERERFEKYFLRSEERREKLRLAELLYERAKAGAARFPAAGDPFYRYFLGDLTLEEKLEIERRLAVDGDYRRRRDDAEHELITAYTLEHPTGAERERFQPYFFGSEEKIEKLRFAEDVYSYYTCDDPVEAAQAATATRLDRIWQLLVKPVNISISRPGWQPLAAVSAVVLGALVWGLFFYQSPRTRGLNMLYAHYAQERPAEARLTGFGYGKYRASHNEGVVKLYHDERDEAFRLVISQAIGEKSAASYQALGKMYLAYRDFNEAVTCFDLALRQNADDAKLRNDLAVALMEREKEKAKNPGRSTGEDTALALEHLHRAIELDGSLLDAHFNLALCHQYQTLWRTAGEDWKRYLEKDSSSPWAEEARGNLAKVTEKIKQAGGNRENIYRDFMSAYQARDVDQTWGAHKQGRVATENFITNRLIDNYISLALSGKSVEAEDSLSALVFIGNIELEKVQDRFTYDLARFYRGASPQQLRKLSAARDLTKVATERLMQSRVGEAINNYRQAVELYDQAGDVCESLIVRRLLGHSYYRQASPALSLPVLTQGRQECEARGYLWPLSLFFNELANVSTRLGRYSEALEYGQSQKSHAKRVEDDYGVLRAINRVTETYVFLARRQETLQMVQEALSIADSIKADPMQLTPLYLYASKCHEASGELLAALDYAQEAFKLSLEINNPRLVSLHYVHLGLAYHRLNKHSEAVNLIRQGGEIGARLPDRKIGGEIMASSYLRLGEVYRETGDFNNAMKSYGDALRLCDENAIDIQWLRFWSRKGLLLTHIKRGDDAAVEEELKQVMDLYEQHRQNINDETSRNNFFDNEQDIYDTAVEYMYANRQDPRRAFDLSEKSRARSLLDAVDLPARKFPEGDLSGIRLPRSIQPLDLGQIQSRLPAKTQILQYSALDKRLIIWVVSGANFNSHSVEIGKEALGGKVTAYLESLEAELRAGGSDHRARSSELYDLLIKPVERWLENDAEICVIPDKALNRLPFASLFSAGAGKYLIEEHVILTSPSANMFVIANDKAGQKESLQTERLLAIGNPQFDGQAFRGLKDLPWASTQASEISALYPNSIVLLDRYAREPDVKRQIEKSDVVHIAAHYIADERTPMLSALPLAAEKNSASKENDSVLRNYELYQLNLGRPRLVVLSACKTVGEQNFKGEGAVGLARPFQAAGIPLIVATLWSVESYPTKELMVAFHKHRKGDRLSTAQALRQAQLYMIRSGSPEFRKPYHWAAYTLIGGHAKF